jgi:uncharacterized membrane protein
MSNKSKQQQTLGMVHAQESFSGPLPHPTVLQGYNNIVPDAAERIIAMAEQEQKHRIETERKIVDEELKHAKRGQIMGFIIALFLILTATAMAILGYTTISYIIFSITIVGLVSTFVVKRK